MIIIKRLPYINSFKIIGLTVLINLICLVIFFVGQQKIFIEDVLIDGLICGVTTSLITISLAYYALKKFFKQHEFPTELPKRKLISFLPRNPLALMLIFSLVFAFLTALINGTVVLFYAKESFSFWQWGVFKLVYTTILSAKIAEFAIFRFLQPDCRKQMTDSDEQIQAPKQIAEPIIDPIAKLSVIKEFYVGVTGNIAMNILMGWVLGGVYFNSSQQMVVNPTGAIGMAITGVIFGVILTVTVVPSVLKQIRLEILQNADLQIKLPNRKLSWFPKSTPALTAVICLGVCPFSSLFLTGFMLFFGIAELDFFQFVVTITAYSMLLSKPLVGLLTARSFQPDYVEYVRKTKGVVA